MRSIRSFILAVLVIVAGIAPAMGATLHSCPFSGHGGDLVSRGFYVTNYQGYTLDTVELGYTASVAGTYTFALTARLSTYNGTQIGTTQSATFSIPTSGETRVVFHFGDMYVPLGSTITFSQVKVSGPGLLYYDLGFGPCQYLKETNGTAAPLDSIIGSMVGVTITGSNTPVLGPPIQCLYSLTPSSQVFTADGGDGSFVLTPNPVGCSWTVSAVNPATPTCIYSLNPLSGSGVATIYYSVAGNTGTTPVPCTITAGGQTFNVTLGGCIYSLGADSVSVAAAASTGSVTVTTTGWACPWTATSNAAWITVTSGATGAGNGSVGYSLAANSGAERTGTITIHGRVYTITQAGVAVVPLPNYSDSWWNAAESGWGITITDHNTNMFVQWYTYDVSGHNQKYVIPGGTLSADKCQFNGTIQHVSGPSWTLPTFDQSLVVRDNAGTGHIDFCPLGLPAGTIVFYYTADGVSGSKQLTRLPFGNDVPHWGGTANTGDTDFTDLWWNPAESGWGVSITQHGNNIFFRIFVYDTDSRPLLFVVPGVTMNTSKSFSGAVQQTTGPYFGINPFDPNQVVRTTTGTASLLFSDANNGVLSYVVNGVLKTKAITRLTF